MTVTFPDGSLESVDGVVQVRIRGAVLDLLGPMQRAPSGRAFEPVLKSFSLHNIRSWQETGR
ncbi:hypothetical protein [Frankia sp. AgW1.1]|uniref:hypothetical protein n=1 Tax=Frankia sp. AgW1.1 TaxID=1836971 RepID=UPI0019344B48|nr:hypothetical protein [Frankia sp. AgW1.1]